MLILSFKWFLLTSNWNRYINMQHWYSWSCETFDSRLDQFCCALYHVKLQYKLVHNGSVRPMPSVFLTWNCIFMCWLIRIESHKSWLYVRQPYWDYSLFSLERDLRNEFQRVGSAWISMGTILYHTDTSIARIGLLMIPHGTNKYHPCWWYVAFFEPWQLSVVNKKLFFFDSLETKFILALTWHDSGKGFFCLMPKSLDCILPLDNVIWLTLTG